MVAYSPLLSSDAILKYFIPTPANSGFLFCGGFFVVVSKIKKMSKTKILCKCINIMIGDGTGWEILPRAPNWSGPALRLPSVVSFLILTVFLPFQPVGQVLVMFEKLHYTLSMPGPESHPISLKETWLLINMLHCHSPIQILSRPHTFTEQLATHSLPVKHHTHILLFFCISPLLF